MSPNIQQKKSHTHAPNSQNQHENIGYSLMLSIFVCNSLSINLANLVDGAKNRLQFFFPVKHFFFYYVIISSSAHDMKRKKNTDELWLNTRTICLYACLRRCSQSSQRQNCVINNVINVQTGYLQILWTERVKHTQYGHNLSKHNCLMDDVSFQGVCFIQFLAGGRVQHLRYRR